MDLDGKSVGSPDLENELRFYSSRASSALGCHLSCTDRRLTPGPDTKEVRFHVVLGLRSDG